MTRILVADDHAVVRSGLKLILGTQPDLEIVGEAASGDEVVEMAQRLKPDIVLLDIGMPGMNGLEAARAIRAWSGTIGIVVLTVYDDEAYLQQFIEIGAAGYLLKQAADTELIAAIRAVEKGESFVDPALTGRLISILRKQASPPHGPPAAPVALSPRETEVLRLVALGYTGQQIGERLSISSSTVETHRAHIMEKLGLKGRAELVRYALSRGLLNEGLP